MYGMTERAVKLAARVLEEENIAYHIHRLPETSWGTVLASVDLIRHYPCYADLRV